MRDDDDATQTEVDDAEAALHTALTAFNGARQTVPQAPPVGGTMVTLINMPFTTAGNVMVVLFTGNEEEPVAAAMVPLR